MAKPNRNLVEAQVTVTLDTYHQLLDGADQSAVLDAVVTAMNQTAAARNRRVFGTPSPTQAVEQGGQVWLHYQAYTEPMPR